MLIRCTRNRSRGKESRRRSATKVGFSARAKTEHHASQVSHRERYEILLHFFEATAAFIATIHLSAFMQSNDLWSKYGSKLIDKLSKQRLSLKRATFGSWKLVVEYLSKVCSELLAKPENETLIKQHYSTSNTKLLEKMCSSKLRSVLQHANKVRNDWSGHAGAIGDAKAEQIHIELMELVQQLRGVFGRSWSDFELLQPSTCVYKNGLFHVNVKRIMGSRSAPFESVVRVSNDPLEVDCLYLFDAIGQSGMKLKPFVQVIPSPERQATACFIFSRREGSGSRFVSYHFDKESEIEGPFPGVELAFQILDSVGGDSS